MHLRHCSELHSQLECVYIRTVFNMRTVLCIILLLPTIKTNSPIINNSLQDSVQFVPVGSTVKMPCDGHGVRSTARWFYRGKDKNFQTIVYESKGLILKHTALWFRKKILKNFDLEISPFTELDEGIYVCQVCTHTNKCTDKWISLLPLYETAPQTRFIIEGGQLSYSCRHNLTQNVNWTFQPHGQKTPSHLKSESTDKTSLIIPNVQSFHAGKYSCWRETLTGNRFTVYSVTVCVLTVTAVESTDSRQNCTLYCDVDVDAEGTPVVVVADKWNISITGRIRKPKSSVICMLHGSSIETDRSSPADEATSLADEATTASGATAHITVDSKPSQAVTLISTCTAALLIIIALVIILRVLRRRVHAERTSTRASQTMTRRSGDEDETQVVYSVLEVVRHQQQNVISPDNDNECVYSQIKVLTSSQK